MHTENLAGRTSSTNVYSLTEVGAEKPFTLLYFQEGTRQCKYVYTHISPNTVLRRTPQKFRDFVDSINMSRLRYVHSVNFSIMISVLQKMVLNYNTR